jgi:hypothetical protein
MVNLVAAFVNQKQRAMERDQPWVGRSAPVLGTRPDTGGITRDEFGGNNDMWRFWG